MKDIKNMRNCKTLLTNKRDCSYLLNHYHYNYSKLYFYIDIDWCKTLKLIYYSIKFNEYLISRKRYRLYNIYI